MKKTNFSGLPLLVAILFLLCSCSRINRLNGSSNPVQPAAQGDTPKSAPVNTDQPSGQVPQVLPTLTGAGTGLDATSAGLELGLDELENSIQTEDIPTPPAASSDPGQNEADQSLNTLQTAVNAEPTP